MYVTFAIVHKIALVYARDMKCGKVYAGMSVPHDPEHVRRPRCGSKSLRSMVYRQNQTRRLASQHGQGRSAAERNGGVSPARQSDNTKWWRECY